MSNELAIPETVDALNLLDSSSFKIQDIGLNILLLKIAKREVKRIQKLAEVIDRLEDAIFDLDIIDHLTPSEQIQRYQLAIQSTASATGYITAATKEINWNDIETKIQILGLELNSVSEDTKLENKDLANAALQLLTQLGKQAK